MRGKRVSYPAVIKGIASQESDGFHDTPSQRVQFILGTEDDDEEHIPHDLFTELDEICCREGEDAEWREMARSVLKPCRIATFVESCGLIQQMV
uniref:Uncharacterized protein n=1 Tax=Sphaerodactylus townsendi TaxID=933632 RepID=A0ACB8G124_9SAUR